MNLPKYLRSSKDDIKLAKAEHKVAQTNEVNFKRQRMAFIERILTAKIPDIDLVVNIKI